MLMQVKSRRHITKRLGNTILIKVMIQQVLRFFFFFFFFFLRFPVSLTFRSQQRRRYSRLSMKRIMCCATMIREQRTTSTEKKELRPKMGEWILWT